jgi:hypothetical protein
MRSVLAIARYGFPLAQMIEMRAEDDVLVLEPRIRTRQDADDVLGFAVAEFHVLGHPQASPQRKARQAAFPDRRSSAARQTCAGCRKDLVGVRGVQSRAELLSARGIEAVVGQLHRGASRRSVARSHGTSTSFGF